MRTDGPPRTFQDPRHQLGLEAEFVAQAFLEAAGWRLEAHRFRVGHNDLDLVMRQGALVAFVEVKARRGPAFGLGQEAIGWRKRRTLARVAEVWRLRLGQPGDLYRFDVVAVEWRRSGPPTITHVADAWRVDVL